jgi:uncharacterized protein YifE (UPF0438 family)
MVVARAKHPRAKQPAAPAPFVFGCDLTVFPAEEIEALKKHGARFEQLAAGAARPTTPEEKHFLLVDREKAKPKSAAERAWVRLKGRREYEREERGTVPPTPSENYGMIEFDADRCWW